MNKELYIKELKQIISKLESFICSVPSSILTRCHQSDIRNDAEDVLMKSLYVHMNIITKTKEIIEMHKGNYPVDVEIEDEVLLENSPYKWRNHG